LFGELTDDVSNHRFLALRVRAAGHPRTRGSYFANIQTEGPTNDDLWQHRLYFTRDDGGWEDVFVRAVSLYGFSSRLVTCLTWGSGQVDPI
jgi:NADH dehydrogenase [ubiquinone] 1 alpha subcomplex assembly factor 1